MLVYVMWKSVVMPSKYASICDVEECPDKSSGYNIFVMSITCL